jgi:hypothetical protein
MLIKIVNSSDIFIKNYNIRASLDKVYYKDNKKNFIYNIFVPISVIKAKNFNVSYIDCYIANKSALQIKSATRIGKSIFEKKFKNLNSRISRTTESRLFKSAQAIKNKSNFSKNIIFKNRINLNEKLSLVNEKETYEIKSIKNNKNNAYNNQMQIQAKDNLNIYDLNKKINGEVLTTKKQIKDVKSYRVENYKQKNKTEIFLPISIEFNEDDLRKIKYNGSNLNIFFIAKGKNNLQIDDYSKKINHKDVFLNFKNKKIIKSFEIYNEKNNFNAFIDNKFKDNIALHLYAKKYTSVNITRDSFKKIKEISLVDGRNSFKIDNKIIDIRDTTYFRGVIEINGILIQNFNNELLIKSNIKKNNIENITCFASSGIDEDYFINVGFYNISYDVTFVELFKRERYKHHKNDPFESLGFFNLRKDATAINQKSFLYKDYNIKDMFSYDYFIKIFYEKKHPEVIAKTVSYDFIKPKEIVSLNKINHTMKSISIKVDFKENSVESIFKKLLRNDYELYKDDLADIRQLSSTIVETNIASFNTRTGEYKTLGNYSVNKNNELKVFFENKENDNLIIIAKPAITDITSKISSIKNQLIRNNNINTNKEKFASNFLKNKKSKTLEQSFVGTKYSIDSYIKLNRIEDPDFNNATTAESTGDVRYFILNKKEIKNQTKNKKLTYKYFKSSNLENKHFFKDEIKKSECTYQISLSGTFPKRSNFIIFYVQEDNMYKEVAKGNIDLGLNKNIYMLYFSSKYKKNKIMYEICDQFGNVLSKMLVTGN